MPPFRKSVELVRQARKHSATGLVNAVLRRAAMRRLRLFPGNGLILSGSGSAGTAILGKKR